MQISVLPSKLVWYANDGAGLGSCLISFSVLIELAKILKVELAVDWSDRAQLCDKSVCVFDFLFKCPEYINGVKVISGKNINTKFTKKGKLIKPIDIHRIKNSGAIYVVRDACKPNLLLNHCVDIDRALRNNLKKLKPNFTDEKMKTLSFIRNRKAYGAIHLRTGNNEFAYSTPHWIRGSILKGSLRSIILFKLKHFLHS